jgi:tetratricopeptide (TPR) repeat protein
MCKGACLELLASCLWGAGQHSEAVARYREAVHFLEYAAQDSSVKKDSKFISKTLATAYKDIANVLGFCNVPRDAECRHEIMLYCRKALDLKAFLTKDQAKEAEVRLANANFVQGTILEDLGQPREAKVAYREAEELYAVAIQDCDSSFELNAFGYFLYRRGKYRDADRILLQVGF